MFSAIKTIERLEPDHITAKNRREMRNAPGTHSDCRTKNLMCDSGIVSIKVYIVAVKFGDDIYKMFSF